MKTTILAAAAVAALCASPARAAVGNWSIPQFVDDYPADIKRYWTEQVNGIAHDDGNWFFTMPNSTLAPPLILKVPAGLDLNEVDIAPHPLDGHGIYDEGDGILLDWGVGGDAVAGEDSNFDHFGDLDQYLGYLFVPVERDGSTMGIAVFRAADLGYVGLAKVQQSSAGWLAYNTQDNYLYSSDEFISPGRGLYRYTVNFNLLDQGNVQAAIVFADRIDIYNNDGNPLDPPIGFEDENGDVAYVQGGVFTPWGDLYITNGDQDNPPDYQHAGIHLFRWDDALHKYVRVADSTNGEGSFNFAINTADNHEEAEGIDFWDVGVVGLDVATQLHAILNNTNGADNDQLYIKHYLVNWPPEANAGPDQIVSEGALVTLAGTFVDRNGGGHTFLWELVSASNGQVIAPAATQSFSFVPNDNGTYVFRFTVTDDQGAPGTATVKVTSLNLPPHIAALFIADQPNPEFILPAVHDVGFRANFTDPGTADTHTALWFWGDGAISEAVITEAAGSGFAAGHHVWAAPGDYTVTVVVTDDDGAADAAALIVHVTDAPHAIAILDGYIQALPDGRFKNNAAQRKAALDNALQAITSMYWVAGYNGMIRDLGNVRGKFDALLGGHAADDWIVGDLAVQAELCQKVDDIVAYLRTLSSP